MFSPWRGGMPRRTGQAASLSKIFISIVLLPTPFLALIIQTPRMSLTGTLSAQWVGEPLKDPPYFFIQLTGCTQLSPKERVSSVSSTHEIDLPPGVPNATEPCRLQGFGSGQDTIIAETNEFVVLDTGGRLNVFVVQLTISTLSPLEPSRPAPTTTRDAPVYTTPINIPTTTSDAPVNYGTSIIAPTVASTGASGPTLTSGGIVSRSNHRETLIGSVLGGLVFLALTLSLILLYRRHRSARWAPIFARYRLGQDREKAGTRAALLPVSLRFRRHVQSLIAVPMPYDEGYQPPESKRERLERVRAEMEEAQRLREAFQLDLERRSMNPVNAPADDGAENGLERAEAVAIRAQIEQMSAMIAGLQTEVQRLAEENSPPDYSAAVGS